MPDFGWEKLKTSWEDYTQSDIPFVKVKKVATAFFGTILLGLTSGFATVIEEWFENLILLPVNGTVSAVKSVVNRIFFGASVPGKGVSDAITGAAPSFKTGPIGPVQLASGAFRAASDFWANLGIFSTIGTVALLLVTGYVAVRGRELWE